MKATKPTKAERIYRNTRFECKALFEATGYQYNPGGRPVAYSTMCAEETVTVRTLNAVQKIINSERDTLDTDERFGIIDADYAKRNRYILDMVQAALDNNRRSIKEFEAWMKA